MREPTRSPHAFPAAACLGGLLLLLGWEASGLDLATAHWFGDVHGFAQRENWWLTTVLHDGLRAACMLLVAGLALTLRRQSPDVRARHVWLLATAVGGMLLVSAIKRHSGSSCPWDLKPFGGAIAHVPHWMLGRFDSGPGHCFPAGHASAGFAWVAGWFAWRDRPRVARAWLAGGLVAGAVMGLAQQARGAHFASHTLWTAWLCWTWAWACSLGMPRRMRHAPAAG